MNETQTMARWIAGLRYSDLPEDVAITAKLCILDTLGVGLAAARYPWSRIVAGMVDASGGNAESTVWGRGMRTSAQQAALANGTAAHGIEMDDRAPKASLHPGCVAVSSGLAATEKAGASGAELVAAVVAGYELGLRMGFAVHFLLPGTHAHKATWVGVAAASRGMGLDVQQTWDALGLAASMASGISEFTQDPRGTMVKRLHAGLGSHNGVLAARLAKEGLTGPATSIEGRYGYFQVYGDHTHEQHVDELTRDLGTRFRIKEREIKPYAAWGGSHLVIDAIDELKSQGEFGPGDVRTVAIGGSEKLIHRHGLTRPRSTMAAQYSLPFVTAVAVCRGPGALMDPVGLWTDSVVDDARILEVADKVELHVDDELEALSQETEHYGGAHVRLTLNSGAERSVVVKHSRGMLERPMSGDELQDKFRRLTQHSIPPAQGARIIDTVMRLDEIDHVGRLAELIADSSLGSA